MKASTMSDYALTYLLSKKEGDKSMEKPIKANNKYLEKELFLFNTGQYFDSYLTLGSQQKTEQNKNGFRFTVWAPHAKSVSLVSDSTDWHEGLPMEQVEDTGMWTVFNQEAKEGEPYKYRIVQADGTVKLKIDPYALEFEIRPKDASIVKALPEKNGKTAYGWQIKNVSPFMSVH